MEQRLSVLTIGANDLPAMRKFYEGNFGWKPVAANQDIVFYKMNGFLFSIGKRKELAGFIGVDPIALFVIYQYKKNHHLLK